MNWEHILNQLRGPTVPPGEPSTPPKQSMSEEDIGDFLFKPKFRATLQGEGAFGQQLGGSKGYSGGGRLGVEYSTPHGTYGAGVEGGASAGKWRSDEFSGHYGDKQVTGVDSFYESPGGQRYEGRIWSQPDERKPGKLDRGFRLGFRSPF